MTPGAVALQWPVGSPASERIGVGLPAGWSLAIGFNRDYWLGVHTGVDLDMPGESDYGQPVYAVADGVVTFAALIPKTTWGRVVLIRHPQLGLWSLAAHLSEIAVAVGQAVHQGDVIGRCGNAEGQLASHVHFELRSADIPASTWPSGRGRLQTPAVHQFIAAHYVDPIGRLGR